MAMSIVHPCHKYKSTRPARVHNYSRLCKMSTILRKCETYHKELESELCAKSLPRVASRKFACHAARLSGPFAVSLPVQQKHHRETLRDALSLLFVHSVSFSSSFRISSSTRSATRTLESLSASKLARR